MRQRFIIFLVLGSLLVAVGEWDLRARKFAALSRLDDVWLEFCVGNSGDRLADPSLTVVRIDDAYEPLRIGGDEPPQNDGTLSRLDYATILAFVAKFSPRSIAFLPTPTFDESITLNKTDIAPLRDAAMKLPRLVVASTVSNDGEQAKEAAALDYPSVKVEGDASSILAFTRTVRYPDAQILANGTPAFKSIESARDLPGSGTLRIPLLARRGDAVVPSLALTAVANHAGIPLEKVVVKLDGGKPRVEIGDFRTVPIAPDGTFAVPARAGIGSSMQSPVLDGEGKSLQKHHLATLTVDELSYTGEEQDEVAKRIVATLQPKFDSLGENLVLIGFDRTPDRRLENEKGELLSETTLLARAIATIQSGRFIQWWPSWARWVSVLVILLTALALFRLPRGRFLPAAAISLLAFFAAKVIVFSSTLMWTPPFVAMSLFLLLILVGIVVPGAPREREKKTAA